MSVVPKTTVSALYSNQKLVFVPLGRPGSNKILTTTNVGKKTPLFAVVEVRIPIGKGTKPQTAPAMAQKRSDTPEARFLRAYLLIKLVKSDCFCLESSFRGCLWGKMCFSRALDSRKQVSRTSPAVLNRICQVVVSLDLDVPPKRLFFAWIRWF